MSDFKVGDWVKPSITPDDNLPAYQVKEIYSDNFGDVLLKRKGGRGRGYGSHYCAKVSTPYPHKPPKVEESL